MKYANKAKSILKSWIPSKKLNPFYWRLEQSKIDPIMLKSFMLVEVSFRSGPCVDIYITQAFVANKACCNIYIYLFIFLISHFNRKKTIKIIFAILNQQKHYQLKIKPAWIFPEVLLLKFLKKKKQIITIIATFIYLNILIA